jgi:hypothetical protein
MIGEPKHKPHDDDCDRKERDRMHQEQALEEALKNTFPASDPVSVEQPKGKGIIEIPQSTRSNDNSR